MNHLRVKGGELRKQLSGAVTETGKQHDCSCECLAYETAEIEIRVSERPPTIHAV
jgi:hypothetical protein